MNADNLFEYIDALFSKSNAWNSVKNTQKNKHHWMIHRFLSIQYPINANELNRNGINQASVADYWHFLMSKLHNGVPKWMYTKTKKAVASKEKSKDKFEPSKELISFWMEINKTTYKDYNQMMEFYPEDFMEELKELNEQFKLSQ